MKYDVLFEPCLTVIDEDGSTKNTGLRDCLINAHRYKSICVPSQSSDKKQFVPLEYCALRFLITFIMDAYRNQMRSMEQIADLIEKGSFDADVIDSYIKICRKDGCTFDLLDEERPFLQTDRSTLENLKDNEKLSFDGWLKKKASTVGNITPLLACGNNDIFSRRVSVEEYADFFDVELPSDIAEDIMVKKCKPEDMASLSLEEYFHYLLFIHIASSLCGEPNGPGLVTNSGAPPLFMVMKGNTLFETILFNVVPFTNAEKAKPMWRWDSYVSYTSPSFQNLIRGEDGVLAGMLFPCRFAYPLQVNAKEKTISKMFFKGTTPYNKEFFGTAKSKEWLAALKEFWAAQKEPHVAYSYDPKKDKHTSCNMNSGEYSWLNIISYINTFDESKIFAPKNMSNYKELIKELNRDESQFHLSIYYVEMQNSTFLSAGKIEYALENDCLMSPDKYWSMRDIAECIREFGKTLSYYTNASLRSVDSNKERYGNTLMNTFYSQSRQIFFDNYLHELISGTDLKREELAAKYREIFEETVTKLYDGLYVPDKYLLLYYQNKKKLIKVLKGFKGGQEQHESK